MSRRSLSMIAAGAVLSLALAACGSSAASSPAAASSAAASGGGAACSESSAAGTVQAGMSGFAFAPAQITAKVGDVISFKNSDSAAHTATLDDGTCTTGQVAGGSSDGLTFTAAGTYKFHCKIHPNMTGTITVS